MPNYSINTLSVTGDTKNLRRFKEQARNTESDLSLSSLFPMPKGLMDTDAEDNTPNWYDWSVENWGTKWDVAGKLISVFDDCLEYSFKSAWNPPIEWLEKVSKDYPTLRFSLRYVEESDDFTGIARARNGKVDDRRLDITDFAVSEEFVLDSILEAARDAVHTCAKISHRISSLLPEGR
jgi:hypothetical protein